MASAKPDDYPSQGENIKERLKELLTDETMQSPEHLREAAMLLETLAVNAENASIKKADASTAYGLYAVHYIRNHFKEPLKVKDIAEHIGISRSYLILLCKRTVGMPPQEYILMCRIEYAKTQLAHTDNMIRDIAASCGYDDPLNFSKLFHRRVGMSPSAYRKAHRLSPVEEGGKRADVEERIQKARQSEPEE